MSPPTWRKSCEMQLRMLKVLRWLTVWKRHSGSFCAIYVENTTVVHVFRIVHAPLKEAALVGNVRKRKHFLRGRPEKPHKGNNSFYACRKRFCEENP
jgi:hypothetical protein